MRGRRASSRRFRATGIAIVCAAVLAVVLVTWAIGRRADRDAPASSRSTVRDSNGALPNDPVRPSSSAAASPTPSALPTPSPIPGYLMVADAGNHRILLIDSRKHVLWRYPAPGRTPSFPLGYDDDVFFGPDH